ncbi:MAG: type II secretion system pilot lipoprotein GspS [Pantoea sp.]|nr:type II secretion system pilot lipoprotein GspS [Pantoea sp.]
MLIKQICSTVVLIFFLTGCQHAVKKTAPPEQVKRILPETQVNQLAAIVAGGIYLREQCKDLQIPEREALFSQVTSLAQQRGWDTRHRAYQTLFAQSDKLYQGLLSDTTPLSEQCAFFKRHVTLLTQKP